jgi:hypothetical protein
MRRTRFFLLAAMALAVANCDPGPVSHEVAVVEEPGVTVPGDTTIDLPFCEEVGRRVSAADCADYQRLAEGATRGMAAFNAPDPMRRGETHSLQLAIGYAPPEQPPEPPSAPAPGATPAPAPAAPETEEARTDTSDDAVSEDDDVPPPPSAPLTPVDTVEDLPGQTVEFEPLVGRFMRAELTGVGFEVTPRSPPSQEVTPDSVTTWTWEVVAQQGGARSLTLTTVVEGCTSSGGECVPLRSTTQNYTVNVEVGPMDRVLDFITGMPDWIKAITAVIVALAGLVAAWFGLRNAFRRGRSET